MQHSCIPILHVHIHDQANDIFDTNSDSLQGFMQYILNMSVNNKSMLKQIIGKHSSNYVIQPPCNLQVTCLFIVLPVVICTSLEYD